MGRVQRYRDDKGHVYSLSPEDAERRGNLTPVAADGKAMAGPPSDKARRRPAAKPAQPAEPGAGE